MTKKQAERYMRILGQLEAHGFTQEEVDSLLRASRVLSTWAEHECNGEIERDETTGRTYWLSPSGHRTRTSDRESGALRRIKTLCDRHGVRFYHQGDPRGCALYIIRPGDVRDGAAVGSCYTNGVAVCID